jgi:hypothetical protein
MKKESRPSKKKISMAIFLSILPGSKKNAPKDKQDKWEVPIYL